MIRGTRTFRLRGIRSFRHLIRPAVNRHTCHQKDQAPTTTLRVPVHVPIGGPRIGRGRRNPKSPLKSLHRLRSTRGRDCRRTIHITCRPVTPHRTTCHQAIPASTTPTCRPIRSCIQPKTKRGQLVMKANLDGWVFTLASTVDGPETSSIGWFLRIARSLQTPIHAPSRRRRSLGELDRECESFVETNAAWWSRRGLLYTSPGWSSHSLKRASRGIHSTPCPI